MVRVAPFFDSRCTDACRTDPQVSWKFTGNVFSYSANRGTARETHMKTLPRRRVAEVKGSLTE